MKEMQQTMIQNTMSTQQQEMEDIEKKKSQLLAQRNEKTTQRRGKITETGQMLMTIDNLYQKCKKAQPDVFPNPNRYIEGFPAFDSVQDFDNPTERGRKAEI